MLVASFMLYAELESAGNMADNLQMLGASMDKPTPSTIRR